MALSRHGVTPMTPNQRNRTQKSSSDYTEEGIESEVTRVLGLTSNESRIYLVMLKGESFSANQLSRITGIHRTRIYDNLRGLENKRAITRFDSEPRLYRTVAIQDTIDFTMEMLDSYYIRNKAEIKTIGSLLQNFECRKAIHLDPTYVVSIEHTLDELSNLLDEATNRVWVCKRTAGGLVDWYVLKDKLDSLRERGVDIRILSDRPTHIGFPSRYLSSIGLSFAIVDSTVISFFFSETSKGPGKAMVTTNGGFVEFLSSSFLQWWQDAV